jgi:hypothetical protein
MTLATEFWSSLANIENECRSEENQKYQKFIEAAQTKLLPQILKNMIA